MEDYAKLETDAEQYFQNPRIQISWQNLSITAQTSEGERKLLKQASGGVKPGEFMAIMGPSGAGKTTFLNTICKRSLGPNVKRTSGDVLYNTSSIDDVDIKSFSGFVPQEDVLMDCFSPKEILQFSANLRLPGLTQEQRENKLETLITALGLFSCQNTWIGNELTRGVSGGERKRTSIGVELIVEPSILFLDEPTTGLDSFTAVQIIDLVKLMAEREQKTIVATIHQPSSQIFSHFDKLLLLSEGQTVFHGKARDAVPYFATKNLVCPEEYNPADYFMTILSGKKPVVMQTKQDIENDDYEVNRTASVASAEDFALSSSFVAHRESIIEEGLPDLSASGKRRSVSQTGQFHQLIWREL